MEWRLTWIYGWPEEDLKYKTRSLLKELAPQSPLSWLCVGDFNEILFNFEKIGGRVRDENKIQNFHSAIQEANLEDLGYTGFSFTWTNGKSGEENIQERLNWFLANSEWVLLYPGHEVHHLIRSASDHCPIIIKWLRTKGRKNAKGWAHVFRFESMWLMDETCKNVVQDAWKVDTAENEILSIKSKIQQCGMSLKKWEQDHFGNVENQIRICEKELQKPITSTPSLVMIQARQNPETWLQELLLKQEKMWHQRSRANWIKDGDRNTSFFHKTASGRKSRNTIERIKNKDERWVEDPKEIAAEFENYFKDLFTVESHLEMDRLPDAEDLSKDNNESTWIARDGDDGMDVVQGDVGQVAGKGQDGVVGESCNVAVRIDQPIEAVYM
ncbi:hypothetical protein DH2020_023289 [Rehmannia glutinosa]|uniref:Exo_endo_phos domain-containing protein n=1 Tax=Rehmannia glutinosa TaxID=99300 RepID=A0ABR0W5L2_REHGL